MLNADDVHLIGIVSMLIASKYIDYYPLKMKIVHEKIAHTTFGVETIKAKEREVLRTIRFDITFPTILTFLDYMFESFIYAHSSEMCDVQWATLAGMRKLCLYFAKLSRYEYKMLEYR